MMEGTMTDGQDFHVTSKVLLDNQPKFAFQKLKKFFTYAHTSVTALPLNMLSTGFKFFSFVHIQLVFSDFDNNLNWSFHKKIFEYFKRTKALMF